MGSGSSNANEQEQQQQPAQHPPNNGGQQRQQNQNGNQRPSNSNNNPPPIKLPALKMQQQPSKISVMNTDLYIRKKTVAFTQHQEESVFSEQNNITFSCDILSPAEIRLYLGVQEEVQFFYNITTGLKHEYLLEVQQMDQPGVELQYKTKKTIDVKQVAEKPMKNSHNYWPMIIQIIRKNKNQPQLTLYYYFEFEKLQGNHLAIRLRKQKMEYEMQAFEVQEIYGIANSGLVDPSSVQIEDEQANAENTNRECIICFTDMIDTVIMPCRHMCICMACAQSIQNQKSKSKKLCPICRKEIDSFLRIKREDKGQQ